MDQLENFRKEIRYLEDLDVRRKQIRLGVQENRISKYFDDATTKALGVIDLGLSEAQIQKVLAAALQEVAACAGYSFREILGTAWAMRHPRFRERKNLLAKDNSFFCSAFVRHAFAESGIDLLRAVSTKNTTPEHLTQIELPHTQWVLARGEVPESRIRAAVKRRLVKGLLRKRRSTSE
jgi:hypothetical protein